MRRFGFLVMAAAAFVASVVGGDATQAPSNRELLSYFCDPANIKDNNCIRAKNYSNGDDCNVELGEDSLIEGRFVSSTAPLVLVRYSSDCESHATEDGGSVIFERGTSGLRFVGYQPGLVFESCATIPVADSRDRLVCITGHMGQGYLESGIAEVLFEQNGPQAIKTDLKFFQRARDTVGALGANTVKCKSKFAWFGFSNAQVGPGTGTALVEASYADADAIRRACARNAPKVEALRRAPVGEAYVREDDIKQGRFVLDLASRALMSEANYTAR
jgi:hypothetical protein